MIEPRVVIITMAETPEGSILVQTKFDPPLEEWTVEADMLPPVAEAAAIAVGAISDWSHARENATESEDT